MFRERDRPWKSRLLPISLVLEVQCLPAWPQSHLWEGRHHPCTDTSKGILQGLFAFVHTPYVQPLCHMFHLSRALPCSQASPHLAAYQSQPPGTTYKEEL